MKSIRFLPFVIGACAVFLLLRVTGLVTQGGYIFDGPTTVVAQQVDETTPGEAVERHLSTDVPPTHWVIDAERVETEAGDRVETREVLAEETETVKLTGLVPPIQFESGVAQISEGYIEQLRKILEDKIHGISFSPYSEGQGPGTIMTAEQISSRLGVISPFTQWIRTFSCSEGNELIPAIAHEAGLKTLVGVWLDEQLFHN